MHRQKTSIEDGQQSQLGSLERHLLNDFQHDLPLVPRPFAELAEKLGTTEDNVIETLKILQAQGYVSRVGAVFRANTIGASTLAAMTVPEDRLKSVAELVSSYTEVNHNYQREHHFNLWFVATAADESTLHAVLQDIEQQTGLAVLYLPMLEDYHIDLGFELQWK
jgi:DNA-binding Lrp family transcriptional regulator